MNWDKRARSYRDNGPQGPTTHPCHCAFCHTVRDVIRMASGRWLAAMQPSSDLIEYAEYFDAVFMQPSGTLRSSTLAMGRRGYLQQSAVPRAAARSRTLFEQSEVTAAACGCQNTTFDAHVMWRRAASPCPRAQMSLVSTTVLSLLSRCAVAVPKAKPRGARRAPRTPPAAWDAVPVLVFRLTSTQCDTTPLLVPVTVDCAVR